MLQQEEPDDYVIATGESRKLADFADGRVRAPRIEAKDYFVINRSLFRPTEIMIGRGDASKAADKLGWSPRYKMEDVARMMVDASRVEFGLKGDEPLVSARNPLSPSSLVFDYRLSTQTL